MKKYLTTLLAACCMLAAFSMPASALEYHFDGPDAGLFGRPTSDDTSVLNDSTENIITLVTCVMNQPDYRWCVQAREK